MFLLKKLFQVRDKSHGVTEDKPFLAHLEDLRDVIVKVVITLLIATIVCYIFRGKLMDVLRQPIEQVWHNSEKSKLPETITPDTWEKAKNASLRSATLTPAQRDHYYKQFDNKKIRFYSKCATYYRAALSLETEEQQISYVNDIPDIDKKTKEIVTQLIKKRPSDSAGARANTVFMRSLKPTETFMLSIKLSVFAGIIISFPFLLYFILQFILPGLKQKERKALFPALAIGFGLFLAGVFFCYFLVLPKALDFFYTYSSELGVENEWRIGEYISFATQFTLIFGLAFELPVVVMTLVKIGLLSYKTMSNTRSYAILAIFVIGAIITPTGDALTLCLLSAPMIILYEICIWLAYFNNKKAQEQEDKDLKAMQEYNERKASEEDSNCDSDTQEKQQSEEPIETAPSTPRIAPVPGRFYDSDDDSDEEDRDDADELAEEELDKEWHSENHQEHFDPEFDHDEDEGEEDDDGLIFDSDEDPEIDFNPGASFTPPPEKNLDEDENGDHPTDKKD